MGSLPKVGELEIEFPPNQKKTGKCCLEPLASWLDEVGEAVADGRLSMGNGAISERAGAAGFPIAACSINRHYREHRPELHARMMLKRGR